MHHVVIIGGGFAGLEVAKALRKAPARVTLIDRRNHHLFQPLLYQVATGGLSPANIAAPIRALLSKQVNTHVLLANVEEIDPHNRRLLTSEGVVAYDTLVVATGANHAYFGHDEWAGDAPGLKTLTDATTIRQKILYAFEQAERSGDPEERRGWMSFAIVGAGPTGVELAGALAELANHTLEEDFREIDPTDAVIRLVDGSDRVLPGFSPRASAKAADALDDLGVEVVTGKMVTEVDSEGITLSGGAAPERVRAKTVLWAAGVRASVLGRNLAETTGCDTDKVGRVITAPDFSLIGHPEIRVIGDLAHYLHGEIKPLPGTAAVAQQMGRYVGRSLADTLRGNPVKPFRYKHYGDLAVIGRSRAIAEVGGRLLSGYPAWLFWLFVHLMKLVDFQNRLSVFMQWSWSYWTWHRSARLINDGATELKRGRDRSREEDEPAEVGS